MKYLLDVNALVAFGFFEHEFHQRMATWVSDAASTPGFELLTCSITELGFVRVLSLASQYGSTVSQARTLLLSLKTSERVKFTLISDQNDVSQLPLWVKTPKQITDGHLARLASAHNSVLATLDANIPRSFLIPPGK